MKTLIAACLLATPAMADCPPPRDIQQEADAILARIQAAPDEGSARILSNDLWALWTDAPDAAAQDLLDRGMARRAGFDLAGSVEILDQLVAYCPDYAEGYNQRAFANFLRGAYEDALHDLDRTLELSPRHVGALSGKALTLIALQRNALGQKVLRQALELNPWLSERAYLVEPAGEEL